MDVHYLHTYSEHASVVESVTKMKIIVLFGMLVILNYPADSSLLDPVIENVRHIKATHAPGKIEGMWKKKMLWKPRWVKEWKSSNVLKPIWRKFWGPVIIREWIPIPKPPPQWDAQPTPLDSKPVSPGSAFIDSPGPPLSGFGYHQTMIFPSTSHNVREPKVEFPRYSGQGGPLKSGTYQSSPLPITSGFNSQAESYSGHSSYVSSIDSSAFDLNPPVQQYNPQQPDYGYKGPSANIIQNTYNPASKSLGFSSHAHRHHHHHHHHQHGKTLPHIDHTHNSDQTKFPPDWNAWNPVPQNPYIHSQSQQGSSPVSVVSQVKLPTPDTGEQGILPVSPSTFQSEDNNFIQQAPLLSEYHYTEVEPVHPTPAPIIYHSSTTPVTQHGPVSTPPPVLHLNMLPSPQHSSQLSVRQRPTPAPTFQKLPPTSQHSPPPTHHPRNGNPQNGLNFHPRHSPTPSHKPQSSNPSKQNVSSSKVNSVYHPSPNPNFPKEHKAHLNQTSLKTAKPLQFELQKVLDFKALPSSFETFHFIEPFPSNQTVARAALVRNINQTESDRISIISPEKAPPYIAKLAEEIVKEHLKIAEKENVSLRTTTVEPTTPTAQETKVTVVLPTTSSSIKKTLKAYLEHESMAEKLTNVFIVTPVPSKEGEV